VTQKILLTGRPGSGKTTLIKRVLDKLPQRAGGFYTEEIREHGVRGGRRVDCIGRVVTRPSDWENASQHGARVGFKIVTLDGDEAVLAHVDFTTPERVGKYRLDLSAFEAVGVKAVREAVQARRLVVIDEIGPMEIRSPAFRDAVNEALDSDVMVLGTIFARPLPFTDAVRKRPDVAIFEVRPDNRAKLASELEHLVSRI
jgi:nucleoside-triphosphatase